MRKLILILTAIFLFGCGNGKPTEEQEYGLEQAIANAENTKDYTDRIFMGFRFGMSENEVANHFQSLLDSGKVILDSEGAFKYMFKTKHGEISTLFSTQYYDGKLCEFILKFQNIENVAYSTPALMMYSAQDVFNGKAMSEGYEFHIDSIAGEHIYYYIKGATIVKFSSFIEPYMAYICAPLCKMKDVEMERKKENEIRNTASELYLTQINIWGRRLGKGME